MYGPNTNISTDPGSSNVSSAPGSSIPAPRKKPRARNVTINLNHLSIHSLRELFVILESEKDRATEKSVKLLLLLDATTVKQAIQEREE